MYMTLRRYAHVKIKKLQISEIRDDGVLVAHCEQLFDKRT